MLHRYGSFIHRRAKMVLVVAAVAVILAAALGSGAFGKLQSGGFTDPGAQSSQATQLINDDFGGPGNLVTLVEATGGNVDAPDVRTAGTALAGSLAQQTGVSDVVSYWQTNAPSLRSKDGRYALISAQLVGTDNQAATRESQLAATYAGAHGPITVTLGGDAAVGNDVGKQVNKSLALAEGIAIPLTLVLLVLAFGSVVAALLPLAIGLLAIVGTLAELFVLGSVTDVSIYAVNLATALGLGLGIDYALLLVARFRERLAAGDTVAEAVAVTTATAGRTVLFSAATVACALAALLVFPLYSLRSFAYAGVGVVAIAAAAALVVIPALLAVLGTRVNKGRLPWSSSTQGTESRLWGGIAAGVVRRPARTALPAVALLLLLAAPVLGVSFGTPDQGVLPTGAPSRQVADIMTTRFAGSDTVDVVTTAPVPAPALASYARGLSLLPGVGEVASSRGAFAAGRPATAPAQMLRSASGDELLTVTGTYPEKSPQAQGLVRAIRAVPGPAGVSTLVGGNDAQLVDTTHAIGVRLPLAVLLIVVTTFVLLFLFTGSVVQPVRALVFSALNLAATFGVMTWIFFRGHLSGLLGFTPRPMDTSMSMLMVCVVFGISMDYEVFVTGRIKELHDAGADPVAAVVGGLGRTGRVVSTAAGLLAITFFAFGTGSVSFLQMFGLGGGLAILLDATVIRGVLVPAFMKLVGARAWWAPPFLRRVHAHVGLQETHPATPGASPGAPVR